MSSKPIFFAPYQTPFVDLKTGIISREWYLFLQAMFNRTGGSTGPSATSDDILQGIPNDLGAAELLALQAGAAQDAAQVPPSIPQLIIDDSLINLNEARELVATLLQQIQDLRQGLPCL